MARLHISPLPASDFSAFDWRVISLDVLDAELKTLQRELGGAVNAKPQDVDFEEDEWERLIQRLPSSALSAGDLSERERLALGSRIAAIRKALKGVRTLQVAGADPPRTALLPATHVERVRLLIGRGELPIAWLLKLDVARF